MKNSNTSFARTVTTLGILLTIGIILPYFFMISGTTLGRIFSPMDLPILLCGLLLGWRYGLILGIVTPILSSILTGMPPLFPIATTMMIQLAVVGVIVGLLRNKINAFINVLIALVIGNLVYAFVLTQFLTLAHHHAAFTGILTGLFTVGLPGIILLVIIVPIIFKLLKKAGIYNG
ncbi:MAG: ECF transporter S component [Clostridium sp.]